MTIRPCHEDVIPSVAKGGHRHSQRPTVPATRDVGMPACPSRGTKAWLRNKP